MKTSWNCVCGFFPINRRKHRLLINLFVECIFSHILNLRDGGVPRKWRYFLLISNISLSHAYLAGTRFLLYSPSVSLRLKDPPVLFPSSRSHRRRFRSLSLLKVEEFSLSAELRFAHFILY